MIHPLLINKKKFNTFLEVVKMINNTFKINPILYGSLGLNLCIGEEKVSADIDIVVPDELIRRKWPELISLMERLHFELKNEHEREFARGEMKIAFARESDLYKLVGINPESLERVKINTARFKVLSANQYLQVYSLMEEDKYRKERRGSDQEKVVRIKEFLKHKKGK